MPPKFDVTTEKGLKQFSGFMGSKSYVEGWQFSPADTDFFAKFNSCPSAVEFPHAYRWYVHIAALQGVRGLASAAPAAAAPAAAEPVVPAQKDDDDDFDVFGDDDDEEEAPKESRKDMLARLKKEAEERTAKKEAKQRTLVAIEVKPWDTEQDLMVLWKKITTTIVPEGVKWAEASSELSFTMFGFLTAMASNFFFVTRNVLATKFGSTGDMGEDKTTRKTNQLAVLTFVAAAVLFPVALLLPGGLLSFSGACQAAISKGATASSIAYMTAASGFYFFMYQLSSFWVLSCVPPITHSVLNTLKRVVIIIVSIVVFRTPVTAQSAAGTATAIGGVLLYSLTKAHYAKKGK